MNLKKILIPLSVVSLAVPFGMPVMATEKVENTQGAKAIVEKEQSIKETVEKEKEKEKETTKTKDSSTKETTTTKENVPKKEVSFTGYKKENGIEYYYVKGEKYTGKHKVNGETFYFSKGVKTKKYLVIEGKETEVPLKGNQWLNIKGYWHFVKDGVLIKGWKNMDKSTGEKTAHWSYFDKTNGRLYTGWHNMYKNEGEKTAHWSYFGPNGWLRTGWQSMGTKANPDGKNKQHMSYFGNNGWLRTGWVKLGKGTSEPDGNSTVHWSYFGSNGWLRTGWQSMGKGTSNSFGENTAKHTSYFGSNGWLQTGWKYFTSADGEKKNHYSYFGGNGWLATGYVKVNNVNCSFSNTGWLTLTQREIRSYINQNAYGYYQGCAGACLLMAFQMRGILPNMTYPKFMNTMPYNNNPNYGYSGNPTIRNGMTSVNAIYPAGVAKWGSRYGNVTNISGSNVDLLIEELRKGNTPIVLVTWRYGRYGIFNLWWGNYMNGHHFNVLLGYDYINDRFKVADPNSPGGGYKNTSWINGNTFRSIYNIQKGAVLVK